MKYLGKLFLWFKYLHINPFFLILQTRFLHAHVAVLLVKKQRCHWPVVFSGKSLILLQTDFKNVSEHMTNVTDFFLYFRHKNVHLASAMSSFKVVILGTWEKSHGKISVDQTWLQSKTNIKADHRRLLVAPKNKTRAKERCMKSWLRWQRAWLI